VTFWARLFEDYGPAEPEDELLPSDRDPISSHGDRPGELLDIDQLTTLMEEELPGDLVAKLEADRDRYLATIEDGGACFSLNHGKVRSARPSPAAAGCRTSSRALRSRPASLRGELGRQFI
jgi:hypothetical protein